MNSLYTSILENTNGGLNLIYDCYPHIRNAKQGGFFAIRDEKHPSAHIYNKEGIYLLKDFGGSADKARDGIHVYADVNNMTIQQAVSTLATELNLKEDKHVNEPVITSCDANDADYEEGKRTFVFNAKPSSSELAFLAPHAKAETLDRLNWKSVKSMDFYKNGKKITVNSTPSYPIFARAMHEVETGEFLGYKIYQPRTAEKMFKFSYYPTGMLPGTYWHGLYELKSLFEKDQKRLDSVVVCSGERDAIVVASMGFYPVWANSETTLLNDSIYAELNKYAKRIYLIPDIDDTGKEMGLKNMRKYPEIFVVWLPEEMKNRLSDQRKSCKDLRDWAQMHPTKKDFCALLSKARPYQFWTWDRKKGKGTLSQDHLLNFLEINGFAKVLNPLTKDYEFVHIQNHIVSPVTTKDMRNFIIESIKDEPTYIRDLVICSKCTECKRLEDISVRQLDFTNATANSQVFFFGDKQFHVTAEGITEMDESSKVFVREEKISNHEVSLLPPIFTWKKTDAVDVGGAPIYEIGMPENVVPCKLFDFFYYSTMLHWRFSENGELTKQQEEEENRALAVKLFHIGYMLHRKRLKSNDWAPIMMDYNTPVDAEGANGGVGKSFLYQDVFPSVGYKVVKVRKQAKRPSDSDFLFDQVTADTDIVYFDECGKDFHYEDLNDVITGDMVVNKKNKSMFTIPYAQVPKLAFLTNYVPKDFDASSDRRHIYDVSSDYFHQKTSTNSYAETRTIMSQFGGALMQDDYSAEDWNADLNLLMQIEQFYLDVRKSGLKPTPPMSNIMKRHDNGLLDADFVIWADSFYSDTHNLNTAIPLSELLRNYRTFTNSFSQPDKKQFKKNIRIWASLNSLEYNPLDVCNDKNNRRIKFRNGTFTDEKIHLRGTYDP